MALFRWIKSVFKQWIADVTGGVIIGALALYSEISGFTLPPRLYEIVVVIVFFQAAFLAWRQEETERLKAEARARELEAEKPNFTSTLGATLGKVGDQTSVAVDLVIYNQGSRSSIVKDWGFRYSHLDETTEHRIMEMSVNMAFTPAGVQRIGPPVSDDAGIPPGGKRTYQRVYPLSSSMDDIKRRGLRIMIAFADVDNRQYLATTEFRSVDQLSDSLKPKTV